MLTDGNAATYHLKPHTAGYSDYFSQSGTNLSCSFLDKLPNPERKKKKHISTLARNKGEKNLAKYRKIFFDNKNKRDEVKTSRQTDYT